MTKYKEVPPKEYSYEAIPVGTRVRLVGHSFPNNVRNSIVNVTPPERGRSWIQTDVGWEIDEDRYQVTIVIEQYWCAKCHQWFEDEELHYICGECRIV